MRGDWNEGVDKTSTTSETVINLKWILINNIHIPRLNKKYEFRQLRNSLYFILGYWTTETLQTKLGKEVKPIFETIFQIELKRYKRLINVNGAAVLKNYTGKGISTIIYKYMVNKLDYNILGDEQQYFGARKLWARLSKDLDVVVDKTLWCYKNDKKHLRSVLRKII